MSALEKVRTRQPDGTSVKSHLDLLADVEYMMEMKRLEEHPSERTFHTVPGKPPD